MSLSGAGALREMGAERLSAREHSRPFQELRAAQVVDMHQLTKDPKRLLATGNKHLLRRNRPKRFSTNKLSDYISEMLSLIGKLAADVQKFHDPVGLGAVNDVEELTSGLSREIWQKIMILNSVLT